MTTMSPKRGSEVGGTTVTITGSHLKGTTKVIFGDVAGTSLTRVSATELMVKSPPHAAARVKVVVMTTAGRSRSSAATEFSYVKVNSPIPDTSSALTSILLWLGLPSLLILAVATVLAMYSWFGLGRSVLGYTRTAIGEVRTAVRSGTSALLRRVVRFSTLGGCLIATSFAISQLAQLMLAPGGPAYGSFYRTGDVLSTAINYSLWNRPTVAVVLVVTLTFFGALASGVTGNARYGALTGLWVPVALACTILSVMAGIAGTIVLIAGLTDPSSGYTSDMAELYLAWVVLLLGWRWLSRGIRAMVGRFD
ncbi:IPT/TIG domain-containing protein [uncultured Friedmanniella sp.]|uniref:IPT/TIG domain-containing protein n=1 Tax=uncultured Friedmanniella sp. TaxID=335381 RepID=UPI0035CAD476